MEACRSIKTVDKMGAALKVLENFTLKTFNKIEIRPLKLANNELTIGGKFVGDVATGLKAGRVEEFAKVVYNIDNVSTQMKTVLLKDVQNLPTYRVSEFLSSGSNMKNQLKNIPINTISEADVLKYPKLKGVLDFMMNKKFITFTGGITVVGVGLTYLITEINKHRERMSGCYRYTTKENGDLVSCKINQCSCSNGNFSQSNVTQCQNIDPGMLNGSCQGTSGLACINCPPKPKNPDIENEEALSQITSDDLEYYVCIQASIADAITDIINDKVGDVTDAISTIKDEAGSILTTFTTVLKYFIIAIGVIVPLLLVGYAYNYLKSTSEKRKLEGEGYRRLPEKV